MAGWALEVAKGMAPRHFALEMVAACNVVDFHPCTETLWRWGWPHELDELVSAIDYLETGAFLEWGRIPASKSISGWVLTDTGRSLLHDLRREHECREWPTPDVVLVCSAKGRWGK